MDGKRIMEKEKEVDERKQDTNGEKSYSYIREKRIRPSDKTDDLVLDQSL